MKCSYLKVAEKRGWGGVEWGGCRVPVVEPFAHHSAYALSARDRNTLTRIVQAWFLQHPRDEIGGDARGFKAGWGPIGHGGKAVDTPSRFSHAALLRLAYSHEKRPPVGHSEALEFPVTSCAGLYAALSIQEALLVPAPRSP